MLDDEITFYEREKSKFDELLSQLGWTEECLLNDVGETTTTTTIDTV
jgi:hypothetical protein